MPVVPVLPGFAGLDGWTLWQKGRINAANVTWSADATDPNAQQNYVLSNIAVDKGYNAIRLVLSAGSSDDAWDDMYKIALYGWGKTTVSGPSDNSAIAAAPRLTAGNQPIGDVVYIDSNGAEQVIEQGLASQIEAILYKCANLGMGVILDCHDFFQRNQSNGAVGPLWTGNWTRPAPNASTTLSASQLRDALEAFWTKTVTRFPTASYPAIIGYEILNEPAPDPSLTFAQMESGQDNCWSKLATRCIKAIRVLDQNTPIVVDGIYYADPYGLRYFDPTLNGAGLLQDYLANGTPKTVANHRLVYSFHAYGPAEFTHQGVSDDKYEVQGLPYPLNSVEPFGLGGYNLAPRLRITVYDGSATAVTANGGSTAKTLYLPFNNYANFLERNQPAIDFQTRAASANGGVAPPIFVGEFSAVDTALIQSSRIPTTITRRVITRIQVDSSGWATVTVASNFNIPLLPQYDASSPDTVNAYSDFARATITGCANSAYNITDFRQVRLEHGNNQISHRTWGAGNLGFQYDVSAGPGVSDYSPPGGAVLTIKPGLNAKSLADISRANYVKDALTMCLSKGFSWAYWQEDGYTTTASSISDLDNKDVFIGWRPNSLMSQILTRAASRRTVS